MRVESKRIIISLPYPLHFSHYLTSSLTAERRSIRWRQRDALSSVTGSTRIPDNPDRTDTRISTIVTALLKSVCHSSSNDNQVLTWY